MDTAFSELAEMWFGPTHAHERENSWHGDDGGGNNNNNNDDNVGNCVCLLTCRTNDVKDVTPIKHQASKAIVVVVLIGAYTIVKNLGVKE